MAIRMAQCNVGYFYREGRGVPQDDVLAAEWSRLAIEHGYGEDEQ